MSAMQCAENMDTYNKYTSPDPAMIPAPAFMQLNHDGLSLSFQKWETDEIAYISTTKLGDIPGLHRLRNSLVMSGGTYGIVATDDISSKLWPQAMDAAKIEKCGRKLIACAPQDVCAFLQEVASLLLQADDQTASMTYIGGQLSDWGRSFLKGMKFGLAYILECFAEDFRLVGPVHYICITYLHPEVKHAFRMLSPVHVSL
eukprot:TRINITY_DN19939_c0_g1_i2.p1 TRINITY_DN19939_c0_g1~~TRINITY_DN19939_c0_g1_i2.p1  ORF type:complete len:201 (+),score=33.88 TRINITY_DN19939_c0_g1_i2:130-732(+)